MLDTPEPVICAPFTCTASLGHNFNPSFWRIEGSPHESGHYIGNRPCRSSGRTRTTSSVKGLVVTVTERVAVRA